MKSPWVSAGQKTLRCNDHPDVRPWPRKPKPGEASCCAKCPPPQTELVAEVVDERVDEPATPPKGCRTLDQRETRLTEMADHAWNQARGFAKDGKKSRISQSVAQKWFAEAVKAERAAAELGIPRQGDREVRGLEKLVEKLTRSLVGGQKARGGAN